MSGNADLVWLAVAGAAAIAERIRAAKRKAEQTRPGAGAETTDEADRTRRVREEIQRRIEERRTGRPAPPPLPAEPPPAPEPAPPSYPTAETEVPAWDFEKPDDLVIRPGELSGPESGEAQQEAAKVAALVREEQATLRSASIYATPTAFPTESPQPGPASVAVPARNGWASELRSPASARRAIVLREILGPPVGLR